MKFCRLWSATFYDCINTIYQFVKPFLDNKMSIFEEYVTCKMVKQLMQILKLFLWQKIGAHRKKYIDNFWVWINVRQISEPRRQKCTFGHVYPANIKISLRILIRIFTGCIWMDKDERYLRADNGDFDQTARMYRLIWVIVGRTCTKVHFVMMRLIV